MVNVLFLFLSGLTIGAWTVYLVLNRKPKVEHVEHDWEPVDAHRDSETSAITWTAVYCSECGTYRAENLLGPGEKITLRFPVIAPLEQ